KPTGQVITAFAVEDVQRRAAAGVQTLDDLVAAVTVGIAGGNVSARPPRPVLEREHRLELVEGSPVENAQLGEGTSTGGRHDLGASVAVDVPYRHANALLVSRVRRKGERGLTPGSPLLRGAAQCVPASNVGPACVLPGDDRDRRRSRAAGAHEPDRGCQDSKKKRDREVPALHLRTPFVERRFDGRLASSANQSLTAPMTLRRSCYEWISVPSAFSASYRARTETTEFRLP